MFQLLTSIFVCILTCEVPVSIGTYHPSPIFPYHHNHNRQTNFATNTLNNKTVYPLNLTIGDQKYSVLLPPLSSANLSSALQGGFNLSSSITKPVDNTTRESRHILHHLFHGLSHGGVKAASGSVSATHSFNLFGKQINYAMGLSYGKPYHHVVSEVPGPYPYPHTNPPPEITTETPDDGDGDDNDDNNNDGSDGDNSDGSDGDDGDDNDGDDNDGDDGDDDDDESGDASVSNYSKNSGEHSGCGKRRGNSHGCNASGSYENLTTKKKKKIRKGAEKPVKDAVKKKTPRNKPEKIREKLQKRKPAKEEKPLGNRKFSSGGVHVEDEFELPSTLWDLFYSSERNSKDINFPRSRDPPNSHLLSGDKLRQLSKISKISM